MEPRNELVAAAGRAIMDLMQSEWEPLSYWELDQRLDRAVEEMIEDDLMAQAQGQPNSVFTQASSKEVPRDQTHWETLQVTSEPSPDVYESGHRVHPPDPTEGNPAVQFVTSLLQSSSSNHSKSRLSGRARLSLSHTVLLSLTLLSKRISYRSVSSTFHLEKGNIHRIFFSFCDRVMALQDQLIQWPIGHGAVRLLPFSGWVACNQGSEERGLPQVLGVVGDTRVPIRSPPGKQDSESEAPDAKRLRDDPHPDSWLNLELVCNAEGRFMYCSISRGSDKDRGKVFAEILKQNPEMVPSGTCLIAGVGYPLTAQILTPFSTCRSPQENLYNRAVAIHLGRFEQAVADLKQRFQKLQYLDMGTFERAKAVVLTACILNNAFLDMGDVTKGLIEKTAKEDVEEVKDDVEGVQMRESVVSRLYSALDAGTS